MLDESYNFFLKANLSPYSDQWIAIVDNKIVSHGRDVKKVFRKARKEHPKEKPLIAKVPGKQAMIL